ncbi:MAG: helix-turn-helix transcriptional regulator [Clostridia bacterium]|nr:helix-turn-helix transcriptional regulator [Clostridia bacterium]
MIFNYDFNKLHFHHAVDDIPDPKAFYMHIHDRCELFFFISGDVDFLVEGSSYPLSPGCLVAMRPAEAHMAKVHSNKPSERFVVNFPLSFVHQIDPEGVLLAALTDRPLGKNNCYSAEEIDSRLIFKLLSDLFSPTLSEAEKRVMATVHLYMILTLIKQAFANKKNDDPFLKSLPERMVAYIEKHLFDEISVGTLASRFHLSTSQFARTFKRATGCTPWEYITRKRLTAARELIRSGHTAREACETCGFNDYASFYRAHTKYFGGSPKGHKKDSPAK